MEVQTCNHKSKAKQDYRAILLKDVNLLLNNQGLVQLCDQLAYVGPFYFESDGMLDQDIVNEEKRQIENCTLAFFLLDDHPCPGTIAEMVYAATLQKKMAIIYLKNEAWIPGNPG